MVVSFFYIVHNLHGYKNISPLPTKSSISIQRSNQSIVRSLALMVMKMFAIESKQGG
jgi:hypothetical protein